MAISPTSKTIGGQTSASSATTASVTLTSGAECRIVVYSQTASGSPNEPTVTGWTKVTGVLRAGNSIRITTFRKLGGGSAGTESIDFAGQTQSDIQWNIIEWTNAETSSASTVQTATASSGGSTTPQVTLGAFADATNNVCFFACFSGWGAEPTPKSGFTKIANRQGSTGTLYTEYRVGQDTTPNCVFGNTQAWVAIGEEIKPVSAIKIPLFRNLARQMGNSL